MSYDLNRREFLKTGLLATAAMVTSAPAAILSPVDAIAQDIPDIAIARGRNPAAITRAAVEALGGMKRFVKPGNKVIIKPNMSFAKGPASASNTHPAVVREVAAMCHEAGASRISIIDNVLNLPEDCLSLSEIPKYCQDIPNTSVNVAKAQRLFRETKVEQGKILKSMEVISEVLDSDVLIAVRSENTCILWGQSLDERNDGACI